MNPRYLFVWFVLGCSQPPVTQITPSPPVPNPSSPGRSDVPAKAPQGVRDIDWKNRSYTIQLFKDDEPNEVVVRGGEVSDPKEPADAPMRTGGDLVVSFGDVTGDGQEEAFLLWSINGGGSGYWTGADIYAIVGGVPTIIAQIPGGYSGESTITRLEPTEGGVVVYRDVWARGDPQAVASKKKRETWIFVMGEMRKKP